MIEHLKDIIKVIKSSVEIKIGLVLFLCLIGILIYNKYKANEILKNPSFGVGEIYDFRSSKGGYYIQYKYELNGQMYYNEQYNSRFHPTIGEKFDLVYQKNDPTNSHLFIDSHYFNYADSLLETVQAWVTAKGKQWIRIEFNYKNNDYEYEKFAPDSLNINKHDSIKLLILKRNPEISKLVN